MQAFITSFAGTPVDNRNPALSPLRPPTTSSPQSTRMSAYPYTGSGYGGAGVPYGNDKVGQPFKITETSDIVDTASSVSIFSTFVSMLARTGLDYELKKGGPFTVFAPTDDAFLGLLNPHGFASFGPLIRPGNEDAVRQVLAYHVVKGYYKADDFIGKAVTVETAGGDPITISCMKKKLVAGSAAVIRKDVACTNGVIHVIKSVLKPPSYVRPDVEPKEPQFPTSIVQDLYGKLPTPRQALGIDPAPASGAITTFFQ